MSAIESIVEELKALPAAQLKQAALYIHHLRQVGQVGGGAAFRNTAGTLSQEEADDWAKAIEDCERIDESGW